MTTIMDLISRAHKVGSIQVSNTVLQQAADELVKEKTAKVVQSVKGLLDRFDSVLQSSVAQLRQYRELEKKQNALVKGLDRAFRYFGETGNPLPFYKASGDIRSAQYFCQSIGVAVPEADDAAWVVPNDYVPATE
jgi:hypothetical protein